MKKIIVLFALCFSTATIFTSCRDDRSGAEKAADSVEEAAEDVGDAAEDVVD